MTSVADARVWLAAGRTIISLFDVSSDRLGDPYFEDHSRGRDCD